MDALVYFVVGILINGYVGAVVWTILDDENQSYFKWYQKAPYQFLKILVLQLWVVPVWFRLRLEWDRHFQQKDGQ